MTPTPAPTLRLDYWYHTHLHTVGWGLHTTVSPPHIYALTHTHIHTPERDSMGATSHWYHTTPPDT